jgi:hypothetical protein
MRFENVRASAERGGLRAAAGLWLLGVPLLAALLIGFLACPGR